MDNCHLRVLLSTIEGMCAMTRLLKSMYYAPEAPSGFAFSEFDSYTRELREFVRLVRGAIPKSNLKKRSASILTTNTSTMRAVDDVQALGDELAIEVAYSNAIRELEDICEHLLNDPQPG